MQSLQSLLSLAVAAFALALVPRRRNLVQVAALSAAVLIAVQLTFKHWFYLYLPWFLRLLLASIVVPVARTDRRRDTGDNTVA